MKKILYIGNNLRNKKSNPSGIQTLGALLEKEGYIMYYASSKQNKVFRLIDMVKSCLVLFRKIDLVLIDTYSTYNFYYAFVISQLCRMLGLVYIPILHGGNLPERIAAHPKKSRMIFNHSKCNVSPSLYLKTAFENLGYTNIEYIPNSFEIENYPFTKRNYDDIQLLWVRSFSEIYNPKLALKAFKSIKAKFPDADLCMIGPDSDGTLKTMQKLNDELDLNVKFPGKLNKKDWIQRSKDYNIFINTTNFDNMPVSVIEAMALGLPVVSTNVGGIPYLIDDKSTGLLVKPDDSDAMTQAILEVFENQKHRELIINNARSHVKQFDWKHIKHKWFNILTS